MKPSEILEGALALIADPGDWCQHANVRHNGRIMRCADQAILDVSTHLKNYNFRQSARSFLFPELEKVTCMTVSEFNDTHTHEEVVALFKAGIQRAKEAGQ